MVPTEWIRRRLVFTIAADNEMQAGMQSFEYDPALRTWSHMRAKSQVTFFRRQPQADGPPRRA